MKSFIQQIAISALAVFALSITGCASAADGDGAPADPEEKTGETASAISADGYASWGTGGNKGAPLDLGPAPGRTCFLEGVTGTLRGAMGGTPASVEVFIDTDFFHPPPGL